VSFGWFFVLFSFFSFSFSGVLVVGFPGVCFGVVSLGGFGLASSGCPGFGWAFFGRVFVAVLVLGGFFVGGGVCLLGFGFWVGLWGVGFLEGFGGFFGVVLCWWVGGGWGVVVWVVFFFVLGRQPRHRAFLIARLASNARPVWPLLASLTGFLLKHLLFCCGARRSVRDRVHRGLRKKECAFSLCFGATA